MKERHGATKKENKVDAKALKTDKRKRFYSFSTHVPKAPLKN